MTREEAIEVIKAKADYLESDKRFRAAVETLIPELAESEDERIRKWIVKFLVEQYPECWKDKKDKMLAYLEKQKENIEKEYVFRSLAGTDITIAAEQAIRRAKEGDHLVLAFNGFYTPVFKHDSVKRIVDEYDSFIEKQKKPHYTKRNALFDKCVENCDPEVMKEVSDKVDEMLGKEQKPILSDRDSTDFEIEVHEIIAQARNDSRLNDADVLKQFEEEAAFALMLKANKLIEQKPEWSEEDEEMLEYVIADVNDAKQLFATREAIDLCDKEIAWLKSLRLSWKPSEEQDAAR